MADQPEIHRGLMNVYMDTTESSFIDGDIGKLLYRGYDIHDLAEKSTFEEIIHLVLYGELPDSAQLAEMDGFLRANRRIPNEIITVIDAVQSAHPMDVLQTAMIGLAAFDEESEDNSREANVRKALRLTAQAPTIVTAHHRIRNGLEPIAPNPDLNHAGNFLYMLFNEVPDEETIALMDVDFILHAEHGVNASSFAARVAASTNSTLHAAVSGAVGTLKGPAHGGAAEEVMKMSMEIGNPENAEEYARNKLDNRERIMGFGHRVYKAEDPRARHLRERSQALGEKRGDPRWFQILTHCPKTSWPLTGTGASTSTWTSTRVQSTTCWASSPTCSSPSSRWAGCPAGRRSASSSTRTTSCCGPACCTPAPWTGSTSPSNSGNVAGISPMRRGE